jgi:hypothetical protein
LIITLGILSLFQLVFLPGLIVTLLAKLQGIWNKLLFSIALSPIINYLLVLVMTGLGLYTQRTVLIIFWTEIVFLISLILPVFNKTLGQILNHEGMVSFFNEYYNPNISKTGWSGDFIKFVAVFFFALALYSILNYVVVYAHQNNSVFIEWDAVVSLDRWAVDWYNNLLPRLTFHYPQVIPANWSLTYQFMGDSRVKFFAKDFMGFIEIYILLAIFFLGVIKRQVGYFIGVTFTAWLQSVLGSRATGLVDSPVAFFALATIVCLLLAEMSDETDRSKYIYFGAFLAAGAAVTKQAGLWIALTYPFLLFLTTRKESRSKLTHYVPGILLIYVVLIFSWYGYKQYQIQVGQDVSEIQSVTSLASHGKSIADVFDHALLSLQAPLTIVSLSGKSNLILIGILLLFSCGQRFYRYLIGLIIVPFTLIWAYFFSYDTRNLNLVIPLIGLASGIGLQLIVDRMASFDFWVLSKPFPFLHRMKDIIWVDRDTLAAFQQKYAYFRHFFRKTISTKFNNILYPATKIFESVRFIYLVIPILGIFLLPLRYPDDFMIRRSIAEQKMMGDAKLDEKLYKYQSKPGFSGKILTDYQILAFLPGLGQYYQFGSSASEDFIEQTQQFQIGYVLVDNNSMSPKVSSYINQLIVQNKIEVLIIQDSYLLVTTCHGPCNN